MALPYPYKKFTTSRDLTYGYIHIKPKQEKDYILFLHGFPSGSHDWRYQFEFFENKGYGIIVPDCLGYGQTSKPLDTSLYTGKRMANDITEILYHEKIFNFIGVGHDWGSFLLSRLLNYHPTLFSKLVFIDIGYSLPGHNLTEQTCRFVNSTVKDKMGYEVFGYFLFFKEEDAADLLTGHADSALSLFHNRNEEIGKKYMGAEGGICTWLEAGKVADAPEYLSKEDREYDQKFFSAENGGFGPSINWHWEEMEGRHREAEEPFDNVATLQRQVEICLDSITRMHREISDIDAGNQNWRKEDDLTKHRQDLLTKVNKQISQLPTLHENLEAAREVAKSVDPVVRKMREERTAKYGY